MANPQSYFVIAPEGDVVLVLLQGHPETSETETNYDVAVIRVYSHRLQHHSTFFRRILERRNGSPNAVIPAQEPTYIPLWNDNPAILAIVLRISKDGPRNDGELEELRRVIPGASLSDKRIDLETFAQIATIVEKYQLHTTVENYLKDWLESSWDYLENSSMRTAMAWMWIAWVFQLTGYFDEATKYLTKHGTGRLQRVSDLEFSIPSHVVAAIDQRRLDIIGDLYTLFQSHLEPQIDASASSQYNSEPYMDVDRKDAMWLVGDAFIIGLLIIEGKKIGFWPSVENDFQGISFADAAKVFQAIPDPGDYSVRCPSGNSFRLGHRSIPKESFVTLISSIEELEFGLSIDDCR